jgi:hypothetical protein
VKVLARALALDFREHHLWILVRRLDPSVFMTVASFASFAATRADRELVIAPVHEKPFDAQSGANRRRFAAFR